MINSTGKVLVAVALAALWGSMFLASPGAQAAPVVAAAGDIACDPTSAFFNGGAGDATNCRQFATSELLTGDDVAAVLPLGDVQYHEGSLEKFQKSYDPSWGRVKAKTRPAIGNHEYLAGSGSPVGSGYFDYFNGPGVADGPAGDRSKGYYSFDVGDWHLIALNSVCSQVGGCGAGSPQEQWLRADLAANPKDCTLAYWHHPRFSSGGIGNNVSVAPLWQALYDGGADVVLNGHDHNYERFGPQEPDGTADPSSGIRQFVVGTGGKSLLTMGTVKPNSEVRDNQAFGVLKLTLGAAGYDWSFVPAAAGGFTDTGRQACHGKPAPGLPKAATGEATGVTAKAATLQGSVNPKYQQTTYRFEYGRSLKYGSSTPERSLAASDGVMHAVSARVEGLKTGVTYNYRVVAKNSSGTVYGSNRTFKTVAGSKYSSSVLATPGLGAYWRLGEQSGSAAAEELGGFPGTYAGAFTLGQTGALAGDTNTAARFDGTTGEMTAAGPSLATAGSIEGWFQVEDIASLLRDNTSFSDGGWILAYDSSGTLKYRVAGKTYSTGRTTGSLIGGWHHVVLTKNGADVAFYIDGALVHTGTGAPNNATVGPWHLMRNGTYSTYSTGVADEIAIYTSALSAATVKQHYDAGKGL